MIISLSLAPLIFNLPNPVRVQVSAICLNALIADGEMSEAEIARRAELTLTRAEGNSAILHLPRLAVWSDKDYPGRVYWTGCGGPAIPLLS